MNERETRVHLAHCNQGEYTDSCKYGDFDSCPALINQPKDTAAMIASCAGYEHDPGLPLKHPNCKSALHVMPSFTMTMRLKTAKDFTLEIMPLVVERSKLPLWRVIKRFKLSVEIERLVMSARLLGYFKINKH